MAPGIQLAQLVSAVWKINKTLDKATIAVPLKALVTKNLVESRWKYVSMCPDKPTLALRNRIHYSTKIDSIAVVEQEKV